MQKIVFLVIFILTSFNAISQKLLLNQVVNQAYGNKVALGTDSLLYVLSECYPFIHVKADKQDQIKIFSFKNKDELLKSLSSTDALLLKVSLSDIFTDRLVLVIAVYKVNSSTLTDHDNFLIFHDERTIECIFNKKMGWVYHKTISIKSHLTD